MGRLFGTDGIRGVANTELTCDLAFNVGRASAAVLADNSRKRPTFVIGSDTRASSDMLCAALIAGLCSLGADVIKLGVVPTPAVAFLVVKYKADAGIMVSASHNPARYNGIKIFGPSGFKLPDIIEEKIEELILSDDPHYATPTGNGVGRLICAADAARDYVEHVASTSYYSLDGMRIAVDCANGSASATARLLFERLGADAFLLCDTPNGENINDGCGSTHLSALCEYVSANKLDCGVAFDGDADRCLFVDENGNAVDGDAIMAICALDLKNRGKLQNNTLVGTIMSNLGLSKFCEQNGIHFIATKVGDRYVLEEMQIGDFSFGGEQSGHIIFRDFATTGDGQITAVQLLSIIKSSKKSLSELASVITPFPQITVNLEISAGGKVAFYTDKYIEEKLDCARKQLGQNGRIIARPSGTEPLIRVTVECEDADKAKDIASEVSDMILSRLKNK